jgi:long-chain acyl-CoA synthetase
MSVDELGAAGRAVPTDSLAARLPKKDDVALIMYTGGSTRTLKGVVLKHSNLAAPVGVVHTHLGHHFTSNDTNSLLSSPSPKLACPSVMDV